VQIHVAAGAVEDARGRVLITKRPDHVHQGGLWELPGGKLETGEAPEAGLARELHEELGIRVLASRPLIRVHHDYGDRRILLDVRRVTSFAGAPHGREGQPIAWVHPDAMKQVTFPAADHPVISALRLPELYLITGDDPPDPDSFLDRLSRALLGGVRLVQLRAHALSEPDYSDLAKGAFQLCELHGARLLLNRDSFPARDLPFHGLHLTARRLANLERRPVDAGRLVGASCHSDEDLSRAAQLHLDYALLSPVRSTASHPEAQPLGWERFATLTDKARLPVYALGGLTPDDLDQAFAHGAQGIAAIRGLWSDYR